MVYGENKGPGVVPTDPVILLEAPEQNKALLIRVADRVLNLVYLVVLVQLLQEPDFEGPLQIIHSETQNSIKLLRKSDFLIQHKKNRIILVPEPYHIYDINISNILFVVVIAIFLIRVIKVIILLVTI